MTIDIDFGRWGCSLNRDRNGLSSIRFVVHLCHAQNALRAPDYALGPDWWF